MSRGWKTERMTLKGTLSGPDAYCKGHIRARAGGEIFVCPVGGLVNIIDHFDRPGDAYTKETYAKAGTYADGLKNKTGKRIPKAGVYAEAGVGKARAEWSYFDAEAKGPNAAAGAEYSAVSVRAYARAELVSASAAAGPLKAKVGLGVDTGASVGLTGVEAKFLGTGFSIGQKTGVSVLGNEVECCIS